MHPTPSQRSSGLAILVSLGLLAGGGVTGQQIGGDRPASAVVGGGQEAPSTGGQGQDSAPRDFGRREVTLHFVWFSGEPGTDSARGGASPSTIRIERNSTGVPSVGVIEEFVSGAGDQWRSAAWIAAITATRANREYVTDYEFLVRTGGFVDGPSAGMLTTVGMLALLRGDEILPETTMSGTINPDGTCGPVGGLPQKMQGAKQEGMTRFGYPVGLRMSQDLRSGEMVDLQSFGEGLGLEVREINNLEDAYHFLTGKRLDMGTPAAETEMTLAPTFEQQIRARSIGLKGKVDARMPPISVKLERAPAEAGEMFAPLLEVLQKASRDYESYERSGMVVPAYMALLQADVALHFLELQLDFMIPLMQGDYQTIEASAASLASVRALIEGFAAETQVISRRKTIGGRLSAIEAMGIFANATARANMGDNSLASYRQLVAQIEQGQVSDDQMGAASEFAYGQLTNALFNYAYADVLISFAKDWLNVTTEEGPQLASDDLSNLGEYGKAFASASAAALSYFEATVVEPQAKAYGQSVEQMKEVFAQLEMDYPYIAFATQFSAAASRIFDDPHDQALFQIGMGTQAYLGASTLVNKYYSLEARPTEDGTIELGNRRLLTVQLENARRRALEAAGHCKEELGFIPTSAITSFQLGAAAREGDDDEKLMALNYFWQSTLTSELAVLIGH